MLYRILDVLAKIQIKSRYSPLKKIIPKDELWTIVRTPEVGYSADLSSVYLSDFGSCSCIWASSSTTSNEKLTGWARAFGPNCLPGNLCFLFRNLAALFALKFNSKHPLCKTYNMSSIQVSVGSQTWLKKKSCHFNQNFYISHAISDTQLKK